MPGPETQADPRVAELMRYQEAIRAAKAKKRQSGATNDTLSRAELDAVAPRLPGDRPIEFDDELRQPEPLVRARKDAAPVKCPHCGRKVNPLAGECFQCGHSVTTPTLESEPTPETPLMPAIATHETNGTGAPAKPLGTPCPDCGEPRNPANNRCYACRPGGQITTVDGVKIPTPSKSPQARKPAAPTHLDPEIAAIQGCLDALVGLDANQLKRVLSYVQERIKV